MARLTWQNVAAPDLSTAAAAYAQVGRSFQNAFANFGDVARTLQQQKVDSASNAELARLAQISGSDQVDAYLAGIGGRIDPSLMNDNLVRAVGGLRNQTLGFEGTRLNQDNTRSVMNQRTEDAQYKRDLTKQSAALNVDLSEAYRLQEAGKYQEADALIAKTLRENPIAASQTDVGGVTQNLRTIQSAPNAAQFTEEGQKYQQNRNQVIDAAIGTGFDEQSVRSTAFNDARNRGLTIAQATALADEAVKVWSSTGTAGVPDAATVVPTAPTGAAAVDAALGTPQNIPAAPNQLVPVTTAETIGGIPNAQAGVTGADAVDQYLTPALPQVPVDTPMTTPEAPTAPVTSADITDPAAIRQGLDTDPNGTLTSIRSTQRVFDTALDAQGMDAGQKAYQLFSAPDAEGVTLQEDNLFRNIPDDEKKDAQGKLQSAIIKVSRDAKVSDKVAKAAVLSTLDPTNWYGGLSTPNVDTSAATSVARQLGDPELRDQFANRSQILSDYRTQQATVNAAIDRDIATLTRLNNRPDGMTEPARLKAIETIKNRIAQNAVQASKNVEQARKAANLERPARRETGNTIRDESNVPANARAATSGGNTGNTTTDQLAPALREAGMTNTEIAKNADKIQKDVDKIVRDQSKDQRTLDTVERVINNTIDQYTRSANENLISQMTPEEIQEVALSDSSARSTDAVWGNVKNSLPDTAEFKRFKNMSNAELKRNATALVPLLRARADENPMDTDAMINTIVEKYKK